MSAESCRPPSPPHTATNHPNGRLTPAQVTADCAAGHGNTARPAGAVPSGGVTGWRGGGTSTVSLFVIVYCTLKNSSTQHDYS